jgi:hypothetical protein
VGTGYPLVEAKLQRLNPRKRRTEMNIAKFAVSAAVLGVFGAAAIPAIASSDVPSSFRALNQIQATPLKDEELARIEGGQLIDLSVNVAPNVTVTVSPNVRVPVTIGILGGGG